MSKYFEGKKHTWEIVLGLEVHAQISSRSKLFSSSATEYGAEPNSQVSLVDAGMPGALPVINSYCIKQAIMTGLGLNAKINKKSIFDRKNYFYPDLPQGYQISQFEHPIVGKGYIKIPTDNGKKKIGITRLHLEQDAGKSIHDQDAKNSLIDLNRSGCALMEIVSEPDLRSSKEAGEYVKKLRTILQYIGSCDGNMEKGNLRVDVNVSVRKPGAELGTRCEIKNVNSIKFIQSAINYEVERQITILEDGGKVRQETRLFDPVKVLTRPMRGKEESHDYRYFPDPDLPPLIISDDLVNKLRLELPELPDQKRERFINSYNLTEYDAEVLTSERNVSEFFESLVKGRDPKLVVSWLSVELFSFLNKNNLTLKSSNISINKIGDLIDIIADGTISNRQAKEIFEEYLAGDLNAKEFINSKGLTQISDINELKGIIKSVISDNKNMVDDYKSGKERLFGFFVGQTMKRSKGKANPKLVNEILKEELNK